MKLIVGAIGLFSALSCNALADDPSERTEVVSLEEARQDPAFHIQGEYTGEGVWLDGEASKIGACVAAYGKKSFKAVVYRGGLPGAGWWTGKPRFDLAGESEGGSATIHGADMVANVAAGRMVLATREGKRLAELERTERKSPTLGAPPPEGAKVIFDETTRTKNFRGRPATSKEGYILGDAQTSLEFDTPYKLHIEFRITWKPVVRKRVNSGVYLDRAYDIQVYDSLVRDPSPGICGGIYFTKAPDMNMSLPPMQWQTFDVEFTPPTWREGRKTANARLTVWHNGVKVHDDVEVPKHTPGGVPERPGPRPIWLQEPFHQVPYRNIWLVLLNADQDQPDGDSKE